MTAWVSLFVVCLLGGMSPGPSLAVVVKNALSGGRASGLAAAWSHAVGIGLWALLTVLGLTVIIEKIPLLYVAITVAGGLYLSWIGIKAFFNRGGMAETLSAGKVTSMWGAAKEGATIAFLNPKTGLFFLALFSPFVNKGAGIGWKSMMVVTPLVTDGLWFSMVTLVLVRPHLLKKLRAKVQLIDRLSGMVFLFLAGWVLWNLCESYV